MEEACLGPLTIIATGSATDPASLFLAAPETLENLRVVWLGGFGDEGSYRVWQNRMGELNGKADSTAWRALLEGPVDLLQVPTWPAAAKILIDPVPFAEELRKRGHPITPYLAEILELLTSEYGAPKTRKELWDLACIAADPESVTLGPQAAPTLDVAGTHDFTQPGGEVNVVSDLDERRILAGLMEALVRHPVGEGY